MNENDVKMCASLGAAIIGFVVDYPRPVPWNLDTRAAKKLAAEVPRNSKSCIVTGGSFDKIAGLIFDINPDYVQLHFGESLEDTARLIDRFKNRKLKFIKTIFPNTPDLEKTAVDFYKAGVYALLFDPRTPDNASAGGTADLSGFIKLKKAVSCPVILAGGINPENAADIISASGADIIDLMTGVEKSPGIKDENKVKLLFENIKNIKNINNINNIKGGQKIDK
jgi:phosphoribosylanthranilate isomerase